MKAARPPLLLVLAVLLAHLGLQQTVSRLSEGWRQDDAMPARMKVAFVREIQPTAPPAPAPTRPKPAPEGRASVAQLPASAPIPEPLSPPEKIEIAAPAPVDVPPALPAAPLVADAEPGPEWPLSTQLHYTLTGHYQGPVHGQAQVEWLRKGRDYQMHLDVSVGPSFAPLMSRRMSSQGAPTPQGISPQRFDEETRVVLATPRRGTVIFNNGYITFANSVAEPALPGAQDSASQFVQLTWLFLTGRLTPAAGLVIDQPLVLARRQYAWRYEVLGEEAVETPMGLVPAWHLKPSWEAGRGDLTAEVWLAPSVQYLPVRLRIRQDANTWIDLILKSRPLQAAPESTDLPRRVP